ncbi:MAG: peptide-N-glycosidase F-related protein [Polyangia bacterium]
MLYDRMWISIAVCLIATLGCGSEKKDDAQSDAGDDAGTDTDTGDYVDPSSFCEELGLPARDFDGGGDGSAALYALATDFTVPTTKGAWSLSARWSGCDSYLWIQDRPHQNSSAFGYGIWEREADVAELFERLPLNSELFFVSYETEPDAIETALAGIEQLVDAAFAEMDDETRQWWERRVHYVTETATELPGWLGEIMQSPGWGVGIDRFQRVRYIGSYADPARYDDGAGWFGPNISMAANEAIYYNHEAEREAALDPAAEVVTLWDGELSSGTVHAEAQLPHAVEMADFDRLELDLALRCDGEGEFGTCPEWDYLVHLYLCDQQDPDLCELELGRWITTYHREGRWVHDISGLLPLLADGGERRFAFQTEQPYELTLELRLSSTGQEVRPSETILLWHEAPTFDEAYNESFEPVILSVPADAARVELATLVTGHGMSSPGNCAEFCNTDHHFYVNGNDNVRDFPQAGSLFGCQDQVSEGTVPNQYGTWWYGRGGWCPGKHVPLVTIDVTDQVVPGEESLFEYEGYYQGMIYSGGDSWRHIDVTAWLVISRLEMPRGGDG